MYEHIMISSMSLGGECRGRRGEMLVKEREHFGPAVERLLGAIGRTRGVEKGMTGAVVAGEFVILAELLEHGFGPVHLIAVGVFVVVAEQTQQRRAHLLGE